MGKILAGIYGVFAAVCLVLLVYLIVRRLRIRKREQFERRGN